MRRKLKITFRNGVTIKVNASDWTYTAGVRPSLTWTTPRFARRRLVTCELSEVIAIVRTRW